MKKLIVMLSLLSVSSAAFADANADLKKCVMDIVGTEAFLTKPIPPGINQQAQQEVEILTALANAKFKLLLNSSEVMGLAQKYCEITK